MRTAESITRPLVDKITGGCVGSFGRASSRPYEPYYPSCPSVSRSDQSIFLIYSGSDCLS